MPRLRILNRDDELHIDLRSTYQSAHIGGGRLRLGRRAGQPAGRPKAVGVHCSAAVGTGSGGGTAIVKSKALSPARTNGYSQYMTRDKEPERAADGYSRYMSHDRAELFNQHGPISEQQRQDFVQCSRQDERVWTLIVSPQSADKIDLPRFAKTYMAQMEADCNLTLDYYVPLTTIPSIHTCIIWSVAGTPLQTWSIAFRKTTSPMGCGRPLRR